MSKIKGMIKCPWCNHIGKNREYLCYGRWFGHCESCGNFWDRIDEE